jgi:acetyl esterase
VSQPLPEIQALLERAAAGPQPDPSTPMGDLRAQCDAGVLALHGLVRDHGPLHDVRDLDAAGVPVRLYVPSGAAELAVHVHLHGGGWWMGSIATVDPMARELAQRTGIAVLSVDYRLAPEHPFPAGLDDVTAVVRWLASGPAELGFRPTTISLGGESAGANLAAATCLRLRDEGGPSLVAQWLDVAAVDLTAPDDESMAAYGTGYGLEMATLPVLLAWYGATDQATNPYVSPALATDLAGLPPALVTTAGCDPLRDQAERYAAALAAAGNEVVVRRTEGHIHATTWFTALTESAAAWHDDLVELLVQKHALVVAP